MIDSAGGHSHLLLTLRWTGRRIGSIRRLQWWLIRKNNCLRISSCFQSWIRIQRKPPLDTVYRTGIVFHDIINHLLSPSYQCFFTPFEALTIIIRDSKVNHQHFEILRNYPIKERDWINLSRFQFYATFGHVHASMVNSSLLVIFTNIPYFPSIPFGHTSYLGRVMKSCIDKNPSAPITPFSYLGLECDREVGLLFALLLAYSPSIQYTSNRCDRNHPRAQHLEDIQDIRPCHSHRALSSYHLASIRPSSSRARRNSDNASLFDFLRLHGSHSSA